MTEEERVIPISTDNLYSRLVQIAGLEDKGGTHGKLRRREFDLMITVLESYENVIIFKRTPDYVMYEDKEGFVLIDCID